MINKYREELITLIEEAIIEIETRSNEQLYRARKQGITELDHWFEVAKLQAEKEGLLKARIIVIKT